MPFNYSSGRNEPEGSNRSPLLRENKAKKDTDVSACAEGLQVTATLSSEGVGQ